MPVSRGGDDVCTGVTLTCTGCNTEMEAYTYNTKMQTQAGSRANQDQDKV